MTESRLCCSVCGKRPAHLVLIRAGATYLSKSGRLTARMDRSLPFCAEHRPELRPMSPGVRRAYLKARERVFGSDQGRLF